MEQRPDLDVVDGGSLGLHSPDELAALVQALESWERTVNDLKEMLARAVAPTPQATPQPALTDEGDFWTLSFAGETTRVARRKGLSHIATLIAHAGQDVDVLDLCSESAVEKDRSLRRACGEGAAPLLDAVAKRHYRARLRDLHEELEEAELFNDLGRIEAAQVEIDALERELRSAVGLGGRDRLTPSAAERARTSVTRSIKNAIDAVERHHPSLARYLRATIRTGRYCSYHPEFAGSVGLRTTA